MKTISSGINIRNATGLDEAFIIGLLPRLTAFAVPEWRDPEQMCATYREILIQKLHHTSADTVILVAEATDGTPLGFIRVHAGADHYHKEPHGHISDLIIAPAGEGRGIAKILIGEAEEWCARKEFRWLTLSVFYQNTRARVVYEHLGFGEDILKCVKVLGPPESRKEMKQ